jgi:hypothetical protein
MTIRNLLIACVSAAGLHLAAFAQTTPDAAAKPAVLVELFTSEGCSSCPPADAVLAELDRRKSFAGAPVVVLSEHVDYWDHDGWHDPFSSALWTQRQNYYNEHFHLDSVYTPQMIIDGTQQVSGSNGPQISQALEKAAAQPDKITLAITDAAWSGDSLQATVSVTNVPATMKGTSLYAVLADDADTSNVARGENSGRTLQHVAVVRVIRKVGKLQGPYSGQVQISLPRGMAHGKMRLILFAQKGENGQVFGATEREV